MPDKSNKWKPGDPCGSCGSTDTHMGEAIEGAYCLGCGKSDNDD